MKHKHSLINRRLGSSVVGIAIGLLLTLTGCDKTADPPTATNASNVTTNKVPKQILPPPISTGIIVSGALRVEPGGFDFGIIEPNSIQEVKAVLYNTGTEPITFAKVSPSCACTTAQDLTKEILPAGGSITFDSKFKAPTEPGLKTAYIQIIFNHGATQGHFKINLQGMVTMPVRAEPPYVNALKGVQVGEAVIESIDGKPFNIITSGGKKPVFADGFNPKKDSPRNSYTIKWNVPLRDVSNCAGMRRWWVIETDHPDCPILPMRVRNECTGTRLDMPNVRKRRGWYFKEYIAQMGAIEAGKPVEVDVIIPFDKSGVKFQSVQSQSQNAHAQLISSTTSDDGKSITCRVRFTPRKDYKGVIYAMVMFKSNTGSKDIPFIAKVVPPENK